MTPHESSSDKPLFSLHKLYNSYNLFSVNRALPLHVVLFVSKNVKLYVHALLAATFCHKISIARFNFIIKVGFATESIYIKNKRIDLWR